MEQLPLPIVPVPDFNCRRKVLVWPRQASTLQDLANDLTLQCIRNHGTFVSQDTISVSVAGDSWKFPIRVIKRRNYVGRIRHEKFLPYRPLVLLAYSIRIGGEPLGLGEIRKLLVVESGCEAQRPRRHDVANR